MRFQEGGGKEPVPFLAGLLLLGLVAVPLLVAAHQAKHSEDLAEAFAASSCERAFRELPN